MKKLTYDMLTLVGLILFSSLTANASAIPANWFKEELTKTVSETFMVNNDVYLGVENKYGDIKISTWEKDIVEVDVEIKVKANNKDKAQEFIDQIEIVFSESKQKLGMKTTYPDINYNSSWWSGWWSSNDNIDFEVHYDIKAPVGMSTKLINKYGNIAMEDIKGNCDIVNKYGDIHLNEIGKNLTFELGYGKARVDRVLGDSRMDIKYSTIKIIECHDLFLESKYSKYKIEKCGDSKIYSKYDEYNIGEAGKVSNEGKYDDFEIAYASGITMDTKYTDLKIEYLEEELRFDGGYGSIKVNKTGELKKIKIDTKYTGVAINCNGNFDLKFQGDRTAFKLEKPYDEISTTDDDSEKTVTAHRGRNGATIDVIMRYGSFKLYNN